MGLGKSIFRHTAIYSISTVMGRLASFLMLPFYAHIFQAEGYGVIGMIDTSLGLLSVLLGGSLQTAILRVYHEQQADERKGAALSTGILLVWGIAGCLILLPLLFSYPLSHWILGHGDYYLLFCLALFTFVIDTAGQCASTVQIIKQQSMLFSFIGLVRLVVGLGLNIWLVVFLRVGLIGIFISSLVSASIAAIAFHIVAAREHSLSFDRAMAGELLRFQLPLLPGDIISFMGRQTERVLVRLLIGLDGVGILEMAYKFPPLINLFVNVPFQRAWRTKSIEIGAQPGAPLIMGQMFTNYLFSMIFAGLVLAVSIRSFLELMTPVEFWSATRIVHIEILTTIMNGCSGYLMFGLLYTKQTKIISSVKLILTPVKIALGCGLITAFGLSGAAYSALLIELVALIWLWKKSQDLYFIPLEYRKIVAMLAAAGGLFWILDNNAVMPSLKLVEAHASQPFFQSLLDSQLLTGRAEKLVSLLQQKQEQMLEAIFNVLLSLLFLALFPLLRGKKSA